MSNTATTANAAAPRRSVAQWAIIAVLAILGILALVAAILFITKAANSIHFLSGSVHHGYHQIRLTVSLVVAVLLLAAAGYFMRTTSKSLARAAVPLRGHRGRRGCGAGLRCRLGSLVRSSAPCTVRRLTFPLQGRRNCETSRVVAQEG